MRLLEVAEERVGIEQTEPRQAIGSARGPGPSSRQAELRRQPSRSGIEIDEVDASEALDDDRRLRVLSRIPRHDLGLPPVRVTDTPPDRFHRTPGTTGASGGR